MRAAVHGVASASCPPSSDTLLALLRPSPVHPARPPWQHSSHAVAATSVPRVLQVSTNLPNLLGAFDAAFSDEDDLLEPDEEVDVVVEDVGEDETADGGQAADDPGTPPTQVLRAHFHLIPSPSSLPSPPALLPSPSGKRTSSRLLGCEGGRTQVDLSRVPVFPRAAGKA